MEDLKKKKGEEYANFSAERLKKAGAKLHKAIPLERLMEIFDIKKNEAS